MQQPQDDRREKVSRIKRRATRMILLASLLAPLGWRYLKNRFSDKESPLDDIKEEEPVLDGPVRDREVID